MRVVELGVWVAGPATGGILADWGADVVKIEPPEGDPARQFLSMLGGDLPFNPPFELDNRSKRGIVVDLTKPEGYQVARDLLVGADVFLTNIRLDALERLRLDAATLRADAPGLIYAVLTGYGLEGPDRTRAAYDIGAFWARSGVAGLLTSPGGEPPFQRGGMGDHGAGMTLAAGVCAALLARTRTGEGQVVATSLLRHGMYTIGFDLNTALRYGTGIGTATHATMGNPAINCYQDVEPALVLAHRPRGGSPLAGPLSRRRTSRLDRRRALRDGIRATAQRPRADPRARRDLCHAHPRRMGRRPRPRGNVVGAGADAR